MHIKNKKYYFYLNPGIFTLAFILAYTSHNHFWHPRAFFYNISSISDYIYLAFIRHTVISSVYFMLPSNISFSLKALIAMMVSLSVILKNNLPMHIFSKSKISTTAFIDYRTYFSETSQAIIPFS